MPHLDPPLRPPIMKTPNELRLLGSIAELAPQDWDALLPSAPTPCLRHAYLHALEASGCVGESSGWIPRHATLWADERLIAAMPLYLKTHSWGEYVFDWAWAEAYQRKRTALTV